MEPVLKQVQWPPGCPVPGTGAQVCAGRPTPGTTHPPPSPSSASSPHLVLVHGLVQVVLGAVEAQAQAALLRLLPHRLQVLPGAVAVHGHVAVGAAVLQWSQGRLESRQQGLRTRSAR